MYEVPPMVEFRISQWFSFSVAIFFQLTSVRTTEIQQLVEKSNNDNRKRINTVKVFRKWGKKFDYTYPTISRKVKSTILILISIFINL